MRTVVTKDQEGLAVSPDLCLVLACLAVNSNQKGGGLVVCSQRDRVLQCYDEFQHVLTDCRVLVARRSLAPPGLSAQHFRCDGLVAAANWRRRRRLVQCTRTSQQRGSAAWPFATPMRCRRPPSWEAAHHSGPGPESYGASALPIQLV